MIEMEKLLDGIGVAYLWEQIAAQFMQIKTVTQNEYNSLTEEEKAKSILYHISDAK